jgi:hypothetical protein
MNVVTLTTIKPPGSPLPPTRVLPHGNHETAFSRLYDEAEDTVGPYSYHPGPTRGKYL